MPIHTYNSKSRSHMAAYKKKRNTSEVELF
jgi:hypothetical protein